MKKGVKWINFIHIWAGLCLNYAVNNTGFFNLFIGSLSSKLSVDAQIIFAAIFALAIVFVGYILSSILFSNLQLLTVTHKYKKTIFTIIPIAYLSLALITTFISDSDIKPNKFSFPNNQQKPTYSITSDTTHDSPVLATTTLQESDGFSEEDLTPESAKQLELALVKMIKDDMASKFRAQNRDINQLKPTFHSTSELKSVEGKRLVVVKISATLNQDTSKIIRVIGFTSEGLISVGCMRYGNQEIPIWTGVCGNEINKSFGFSIYQGFTED